MKVKVKEGDASPSEKNGRDCSPPRETSRAEPRGNTSQKQLHHRQPGKPQASLTFWTRTRTARSMSSEIGAAKTAEHGLIILQMWEDAGRMVTPPGAQSSIDARSRFPSHTSSHSASYRSTKMSRRPTWTSSRPTLLGKNEGTFAKSSPKGRQKPRR